MKISERQVKILPAKNQTVTAASTLTQSQPTQQTQFTSSVAAKPKVVKTATEIEDKYDLRSPEERKQRDNSTFPDPNEKPVVKIYHVPTMIEPSSGREIIQDRPVEAIPQGKRLADIENRRKELVSISQKNADEAPITLPW
jgi:hypothetical protein